jgi:hypothetical protein
LVPPDTGIEEVLADVEAIPGVRIVDYDYPDDSIISPMAVATTVPIDGPRDVGSLFLVVSDERDALDAASQVIGILEARTIDYAGIIFSDEIAQSVGRDYFDRASKDALVLGDEPRVLQPGLGPEPEFDTSALGTEVILEPASSLAEIPDAVFAEEALPSSGAHRPKDSLPLLHVGFLSEIRSTLMVYGSSGDLLCSFAVSETFSGGGCGGFNTYPYGLFGSGGKQGDLGYSIVFVPESTAAVVLVVNDSDPMWQRPRAGWNMFPTPIVEGTTATAVAYASTGLVLGEWEEAN